MYNTILVNKKNKLKENYLKKINLVSTTDIYKKEILIEENTYNAFLELKDFFKSKNIIIGIESAYRSLKQQQEIYEAFLKKNNEESKENIISLPGNSEHHTGLALDINLIFDKEKLKNSDLLDEVHSFLSKFGFILRYPKGKEKITGHIYNPYHIRYVGKIVSKIIYENNLTLEEYLEQFNGVIAVKKEKGITSFDVVNEISHLFGIKKVGHTGTLDPLAEGVLIVTIGKATKIVELLTAEDKEYIAEAKLGIKTDTYDITGKILATKEIEDKTNLKEIIKSFQKTYKQEVPVYSAIKVNGKKLYEYARNNQQVELPKKEVTIKNIELLSYTKDTFKIKTLVSKGTYIRSLINDIGNKLNTYATMTSLLRTKQGNVNLKDTYSLEEIKNNKYKIYKIEEVLNFKTVCVDKDFEFKITNGQKINNLWKVTDKIILKNKSDKLLGIYQVEKDHLKVWKNFN